LNNAVAGVVALMSERELHDLGIKRYGASQEAHKPLWRA
jgi:uncharacterized protein YjiS (DUF1127 family)